MLFTYYGPTTSRSHHAVSTLPSTSDLPKSWLHHGPYSSSKRKSRWALNLPPWRKKASPAARGMRGPSCNHSFIHGSYSSYMPCPIPVLDRQEWTRWHSPSSSHTAQTGHRSEQALWMQCTRTKACRDAASLTAHRAPLRTRELGCGSRIWLRRQILTRSGESAHSISTLLTTLSSTHGRHNNQTTPHLRDSLWSDFTALRGPPPGFISLTSLPSGLFPGSFLLKSAG